MSNTPVRVGKSEKVHISSINARGQGVARIDGYVVFVPGALPGEDCLVQIINTTKNYGIAKVIKRYNKSKLRTNAPCEYFGRCGGCQLQHMKYQGQLLYKQKKIIDAVKKISGKDTNAVMPVLGMEKPWAYRNKTIFSVRQTKDGPSVGFYLQNSHMLIDIKRCIISSNEINQVLEGARNWMQSYHIMGYDEKHGAGDVKNIFAKAGSGGQVMAGVVTAGAGLPAEEALINELRRINSSIVSIFHNINSERTSVALGNDTRFIWGRQQIEGSIGPLTFEMSPDSFYQVNPEQTLALYNVIKDMAGLTGEETVFDAYCGVGTIGQYISKYAGSVIGIESHGSSVSDARENARRNRIKNVEYLAGECGRVMPQLVSAGKIPGVVIMDPPRKGCEKAFMEALASAAPKRVIYVSCNPATMARDIKQLLGKGYSLEKIQPVDMFPHTTHVETVVLMSREK